MSNMNELTTNITSAIESHADEIREHNLHRVRLSECMDRIRRCPTYPALYALESYFNDIGLTVQTSQRGRPVITKIVDGRPSCRSITEDHMFVGSGRYGDDEISSRMIECIIEFVERAAGPKAELKKSGPQRAWQENTFVYGNADVSEVMQDLYELEV